MTPSDIRTVTRRSVRAQWWVTRRRQDDQEQQSERGPSSGAHDGETDKPPVEQHQRPEEQYAAEHRAAHLPRPVTVLDRPNGIRTGSTVGWGALLTAPSHTSQIRHGTGWCLRV